MRRTRKKKIESARRRAGLKTDPRAGMRMKHYTVECLGCKRKYDLDVTGPVKFCSFCASPKLKLTKRDAELGEFGRQLLQGFAMGAGIAMISRMWRQADAGKNNPFAMIPAQPDYPAPPSSVGPKKKKK